MQYYVFHECSTCGSPFFGGAARCAAEGDGDRAEEDLEGKMVCVRCSGAAVEMCEKHDPQWMNWKCRFCCSVAVFHCFGNTRFCSACHDNHIELVNSSNGENRLPLERYPQCAGIRERLRSIAAIPSLTETEREERRKKCFSGLSLIIIITSTLASFFFSLLVMLVFSVLMPGRCWNRSFVLSAPG